MKLGCVILAALLLLVGLLLAQLPSEPPAAADTVRGDSLSIWSDTAAVFPDSTARMTLRHGWLYPMGVIMATCIGFMLLFTTRSH